MNRGKKRMMKETTTHAPTFEAPTFMAREQKLLAPFFTNLTESVYAITIPNPEVVGAICSRASRAEGDLREVFLREYLLPTLQPKRQEDDTDDDWREIKANASNLTALISELQSASITERFANKKARVFFDKWLAQFGDDSIAQMSGTHIAYGALSQIALKHLEDQRIGLAPIEKSTRYVNYSGRVDGRYMYYTPPELLDERVRETYEDAMVGLFDAYADIVPKVHAWLVETYPDVLGGVAQKKAFDLLRGLLPMSTLSQVAFFANGQAAEYLITRGRAHGLMEVQWAAERAKEEWQSVIPSFIRRVDSEMGLKYQKWLRTRRERLSKVARERFGTSDVIASGPDIRLLNYQDDGENRVIAGLLYSQDGNGLDFSAVLHEVERMSDDEKRTVLEAHFKGRHERWEKPHRALELAEMTFEIVMNAGAYRDLHRHRMLSQQRQLFTVVHGYDVPRELKGTEFEAPFMAALDAVSAAHRVIADTYGAEVAQYATALAHRMRFIQEQNLRSAFWTTELRTIPEGHPDYRMIEQRKFELIKEIYPLLAKYMMVDLDQYDFARRGQAQKIAAKERALKEVIEE